MDTDTEDKDDMPNEHDLDWALINASWRNNALGWLVYGEVEVPIVSITLNDGMVLFTGKYVTRDGEVFGIDQNTGVAILGKDRSLIKMQPRKGVPDVISAAGGGTLTVYQTVKMVD